MTFNRDLKDQEMLRIVDRLMTPLRRDRRKFLINLARPLDARWQNLQSREMPFGTFVANIIKSRVKTQIGIINGGTIRGDQIFYQNLTYGEINGLFPRDDRIVKMKVSGRILLEALEEGLYDYPNANGRFPHVAGAKIYVKQEIRQGERKIEKITVMERDLGNEPKIFQLYAVPLLTLTRPLRRTLRMRCFFVVSKVGPH